MEAGRGEYGLPDTKYIAHKALSEKRGMLPKESSLGEYDREALMEEQGRKAGMRLPKEFKEAFDQYDYNKDQEDLKTPGYNKRSIDNPYGRKP